MISLSKHVGFVALTVAILGLGIAPDACAAGHLKIEKPAALRKAQALHRAKKKENQMKAKQPWFHHHQG